MDRADLLDALIAGILAVERPHPVRVGIDGVDAAGKTTLADALAPRLEAAGRPVIRASIDRFHQPAALRYRRGRESPEGYYLDSFDLSTLTERLLRPLGPEGSRRFRRACFDHASDSPVEAPLETAAPDAILVFDGVFLHRPELRLHWDFSVFLQVDFRVSVPRAVRRDVSTPEEEVRRIYATRYVPGQRLYLDAEQPWERASVVVDHGDPERPRILGGG